MRMTLAATRNGMPDETHGLPGTGSTHYAFRRLTF